MHGSRLLGDTAALLAAQAAAFEALLLAASAAHKAIRRGHLRLVLHRFAGVSTVLVPVALAGIVAVELAAAGLLWMPGLRLPGALLASAVWTLYLLLILRAIAQDRRDVDCGCSFGPAPGPLGLHQVLRNGVLLALAAFVACNSVPAGVAIQSSQVLAGIALLALYAALDQVLALRPLRPGEAA